MKKFKLFAGIALFVKSLMLVTVIVVLSIQKKSIPKAIIAILGTTSVMSAWLLISYRSEERRNKKLCEMDAFYDSDYEAAFNDIDDEDDSEYDDDFNLGLDDNIRLIPEVD